MAENIYEKSSDLRTHVVNIVNVEITGKGQNKLQWSRPQNNVQNNGVFVLDVSLDISATIRVTLQQIYNPERMKRKIIYLISVFSCRKMQVMLFHL